MLDRSIAICSSLFQYSNSIPDRMRAMYHVPSAVLIDPKKSLLTVTTNTTVSAVLQPLRMKHGAPLLLTADSVFRWTFLLKKLNGSRSNTARDLLCHAPHCLHCTPGTLLQSQSIVIMLMCVDERKNGGLATANKSCSSSLNHIR